MEEWKEIAFFPGYSVSTHGRVRTDKTGKLLQMNLNQYGLLQVGLMRDGVQRHRSVPLLVANAFLSDSEGAFDTPINLDGDRHNNRLENLTWRPRWFAIRYNRQFKHPYEEPILKPLVDIATGVVSENSLECAKKYGLLEKDIVQSIINRTFVWPTFQQFGVVE